MPLNTQTNKGESELNILDYLLTIYRRRWALILMTVVITGIAVVASLRMPKLYQARAVIKISQQPEYSELSYSNYRYLDPYFINTEIALIKSRTLNYKVVNELGLAYEIIEASPGLGNAIATLELKEGTRAGTLIIEFKSRDSYQVIYDGKPVGVGYVNKDFEGDFGRLKISTGSGAAGKKIELALKNIDDEVTGLIGGITVNPIADVNMVELVVTGRDPEKIKLIANTLSDEYVYQSLEDKRLQASSTRRFIEDQLERIRKNLDQAGNELMDFKKREGIIDIDVETNRRILTMTTLENEILQATIDRQMKRREINELRLRAEELGTVEPENGETYNIDFSYFSEDSRIGAIERRIMELEDERSELMVNLTPEHPRVKKIDSEIDRLYNDLSAELDHVLEDGKLATELDMADKEIAYLDNTYNEYYNYISNIPEKELELNRLTRQYQINETMYFSLMEKLQESQIRESMENADIRVIDYAITPRKPTSPNHVKNIGLGFVLGLLLGLGLAFILEFADTSLTTVEEVEKTFNYPVVGIIPITEGFRGASFGKDGAGFDNKNYTVTLDRPKAPISESFRSLRTAILTAAVDQEKYCLVVTSSSLSEGKSSTITNLGIVLAQLNKKVVIIDSDLRRSILHRSLNAEKAPGLSELLLGEATLKKCLQPTEQENLMLITSGHRPPNPSELLGSRKLQTLIKDLYKQFDFILFDAPPVLAVTDPLILCSITDGTLFVISAGNTDRKAARRALQMLEQTNAHIIGIVFSQVKMDRSLGGYGYKYYAQYYSTYGEED